jgi:hypothetical protein
MELDRNVIDMIMNNVFIFRMPSTIHFLFLRHAVRSYLQLYFGNILCK